jgi:hypothetical protein
MRRALILALILTQTACATAVNGRYQSMVVDSQPAGARVELDDCGRAAPVSVITPAVVKVARRATNCKLTFSMEDREPRTVTLKRRLTGGPYLHSWQDWCGEDLQNCNSGDDLLVSTFLATVIFLPSLVIDTASGALFEQSPKAVIVSLDPPAASGQ